MIKPIFKFLIPKLKEYSLTYLLRWQLEELTITTVSYIPTIFGIVLRYFAIKIFFLESRGFQWLSTNVHIVHSARIRIGAHVGINSNTYLNGVGFIDIGDYVLIGNNVTISSGMHPIAGKYPEIYKRPSIPKKIIIENGVWIGAGAVIMPGVTLGAGSVIGANSIVNKDTRPYSINVGAPIREIGTR